MTAPPVDVHTYYRQVTDVDIGEIARELLGDRITQESRQTLFCDCPNHRSQSHRSLHVWRDKQGWFCHACGTGGDVLQLVEFVRFGIVTRGQSGSMPDSHRQARDFLAARVRLPPLSKLASGSPEEAEEAHQLTLRVREALTALQTCITSAWSGIRKSSPGFEGNMESARRRSAGSRSGMQIMACPAWRAL